MTLSKITPSKDDIQQKDTSKNETQQKMILSKNDTQQNDTQQK
jgi:hypothetical protein